jgi:hypothetical protein
MSRALVPPDPQRTLSEHAIRLTDLERVLNRLRGAGVFDLVFSRSGGPEVSLPYPVTVDRHFRGVSCAVDELQSTPVTARVLVDGSEVATVTVPAGQWRNDRAVTLVMRSPQIIRMELAVEGVVKLDGAP